MFRYFWFDDWFVHFFSLQKYAPTRLFRLTWGSPIQWPSNTVPPTERAGNSDRYKRSKALLWPSLMRKYFSAKYSNPNNTTPYQINERQRKTLTNLNEATPHMLYHKTPATKLDQKCHFILYCWSHKTNSPLAI